MRSSCLNQRIMERTSALWSPHCSGGRKADNDGRRRIPLDLSDGDWYLMAVMVEIPAHIQGLVFDCDGTIADTMPLHYQAWMQALREHRAEFPEAMFYEMAGIPTVRIIELLNERHGYRIPVQEAADYKESLYIRLIDRVEPIEPVVRLVKAYAGRLPMAVATGGTRAICSKTLKSLHLLEHFQAIVTADDVEHGKPA